MELNKIYNMDCLEGMRSLPDNSVDLIVTDPPYLVETQGAGFFGKKSDEYSMQYKGKKAYTYGGERYVMKEINPMKDGITESFLDEMCRVMKQINIYLWCSQKQLIPYIEYFVKKHGCYWNLLSWHKTNPIPACGNKYVTDTEFCLFFREKGVRLYGDYKSKATYYVSPSNMTDKRRWHHPTIKPLNIIKNLLINSSIEGGVILDPFMGSGTTAIACAQSNRNFIGFELNKEYYDMSLKRIQAELAEPTLF